MRHVVAVLVSILMTALPFKASASDTVSATIFISVTIHPQSTVEAMSAQGDACASLLLDNPLAYLDNECDLLAGNFEVSRPQQDTLLIEPI